MKQYLAAVGGIILATILLAPFSHSLSTATVALVLLLVVLFVATAYGSRPAFLASI